MNNNEVFFMNSDGNMMIIYVSDSGYYHYIGDSDVLLCPKCKKECHIGNRDYPKKPYICRHSSQSVLKYWYDYHLKHTDIKENLKHNMTATRMEWYQTIGFEELKEFESENSQLDEENRLSLSKNYNIAEIRNKRGKIYVIKERLKKVNTEIKNCLKYYIHPENKYGNTIEGKEKYLAFIKDSIQQSNTIRNDIHRFMRQNEITKEDIGPNSAILEKSINVDELNELFDTVTRIYDHKIDTLRKNIKSAYLSKVSKGKSYALPSKEEYNYHMKYSIKISELKMFLEKIKNI